MITKNYKSIFSYIAAFTIGFFMVSCDQEDNIGLATLSPTSPSITVSTEVSSKSLIEDNSVYGFTVTLSEVQLVDTKIYVNQVSGTATMGDDFEVTPYIVIPAGSLSGKGSVKILSDDLIEETETVKIQIGDERVANGNITTATMDFSIQNYTEGDLVIDLSWALASKTTDNSGETIDPDDFADMRLLISSTPDNSGDIDEADGGSFETLVLDASTPNGDYYIVADFYDANSEIVRDIDLFLNFNQSGVINDESHEFLGAISNLGTCSLNFYVMAKITKTGNTYSVERVAKQSYEYSVFVPWFGIDADYDSQVSTKSICDGLFIKGLNAEWMLDWWGEIVIDESDVFASIDEDGNVTIAKQFLYETTYDGDVQPKYYVYGSGTYNESTGELYIKYDLEQGSTKSLATAIMAYGWPTPYFEATLTLAP